MLNINDLIKRINANNYQYFNDGININIDNRVKLIIRGNSALIYKIDSLICEGDESKINYENITEPLSNQSIEILQNIGCNYCNLFDGYLTFNFDDNSTSDSISISNLSNEIFENFSSFIEECSSPITEELVYNVENEDLYKWFNFANDKYSYLMKDGSMDEKGFIGSYLRCRLLNENFVNSDFATNRRNRKNNSKIEISVIGNDDALNLSYKNGTLYLDGKKAIIYELFDPFKSSIFEEYDENCPVIIAPTYISEEQINLETYKIILDNPYINDKNVEKAKEVLFPEEAKEFSRIYSNKTYLKNLHDAKTFYQCFYSMNEPRDLEFVEVDYNDLSGEDLKWLSKYASKYSELEKCLSNIG